MAGAFQSGFGMGQRAYQQGLDNDRQAKMDARQALMDSRADQEYERAQGMQRGVDEAFGSMQSLQRGVYDGSNADFNTPNPAMLDQGPLPRAAQPQLGLTQRRSESDEPAQPVARRNATELEMEQAMGNVALAQRDMTGLRNSRGAQKQLFKQQDQRDFVADMQKLAASDDPKDQAKYQERLSPALSAYSQFTGIPSNFHFDPTTKSIVETPYGKKNEDGTIAYGTPRGVPMEQAMPYLLAHRALTQDYGDTETAFKAMQGMKEEERNRLIAEHQRNFAQATGLSKAQNDRDSTAATVDYRKDQARYHDAVIAETARHNQARERLLGASAKAAGRGQAVQLTNDKGEAGLFYLDKTNAKTGMVELPTGWKFPNQKPQTTVNPDGTVMHNGTLHERDSKTGNYRPVKGLGPTATELALQNYAPNKGGGLKDPAAPAPAAPRPPAPPAPPAPFTGLEGLDSRRLESIARNPDNPLSIPAAQLLQKNHAAWLEGQRERVMDDQYNPDYYR